MQRLICLASIFFAIISSWFFKIFGYIENEIKTEIKTERNDLGDIENRIKTEIKTEIDDEEFQAGLAILDNMDESYFNINPF